MDDHTGLYRMNHANIGTIPAMFPGKFEPGETGIHTAFFTASNKYGLYGLVNLVIALNF